ncbi:MAG: LPS export ABC transporter permease LptG [Variibacter sp.]
MRLAITGTFARYVGRRFIAAVAAVFIGIFLLVVLIDYIEMTRRTASIPNIPVWMVAATSLYRVPQITERLLPFSVLIGAMVAYLNLSRRNELVIARAAGMSAWQFIAPTVAIAFVMGIAAAVIYNPLAATLGERAKKYEETIFGSQAGPATGSTYWIRQRSGDGQSILHAATSREQGAVLAGITVFTFDPEGRFAERIEAETARLEPGHWRLENARIYSPTAPPREIPSYLLATNLNSEQVRESFATPETVSFWQLPQYIQLAERAGLAASGYRLQYQGLLARPFMLAAMVLLAAAVSLRFFRFGGVQRMVLSGIAGGFLLYVLAKVTEDLGKAELIHPLAAAWSPAFVGSVTGIMALLFQEDG